MNAPPDNVAPPDPFTIAIRAAVRAEVAPLLEALAEAAREPQYRSRQEESARLGISVPTLDRLVREQGLPFVRVGDSRRFRAAEVDAWLNAQREAEAAE